MDTAVIEILLTVTAAWVLFFIGVLHTTRAAAIRREKRRSKTWIPGRMGSPTSNSRQTYTMNIDGLQKKGSRVLVTGSLVGAMPHRNETAYLEAEGERVIVLILSLRDESMQKEEKGVRVSMKLMGVPRALRDKLSTTAEARYTVTNLRLKKETPEEAAKAAAAEKNADPGPAQPVPEAKPIALHYPIVVMTPLREVLQALVPTVIGFLLLMAGVVGTLVSDHTTAIAVSLVLGGLMGGFGGFLLVSAAGFRLTVNDTQVLVRRYFRTTVYHIDNLRTHAHLATDSSEKWIMDITNAAGGPVATINSSYVHYDEVFEAFRLAVKRQNEERRQAALRRYLTETDFFVLGFTIETADQKIVMPRVMTRKDNGKRTLFLFDSEANAHQSYPREPLVKAKLSAVLAMEKELKASVLAIWSPANGMKPLEVTEDFLRGLNIRPDGTGPATESAAETAAEPAGEATGPKE